MDNVELFMNINKDKDNFFNELKQVIVGQDEVIEHILIAILCKGHILLEGVPGLGKTLIIKTISDILNDFSIHVSPSSSFLHIILLSESNIVIILFEI